MLINLLAAGLGGAIGSMLRLSFGLAASALLGTRFPWATLGVNIIGSFLIGVAVILIGDKILAHDLWRPFFVVGLLGAFTTFSSFSLDTLLLLQQGNYNSAIAYVATSFLVCLAATLGGMQLSRLFV